MKIYETLESGIKIVEYEPSLAPSLAEMWNICNQNDDDEWSGESGVSTASQVIAEHEGASHFNVYLALDGDDVVGYCSFERYFADANTLYVALLGVRPDYRSKKIGKALILRCVERTIELGYPRLDLFTWSGNTAAVPLYKKCGFLWEDRPDTTHLVNFIPTILTTPLFESFFKKANWYDDSTRSLEITPDGKKTNGFEFFGYSWEKDEEYLNIGYERSGRQMRLLETNDYKIELVAPQHELAFGLEYDCKFIVENKTGKDLNVKIGGKQDQNITLACNVDMQNVTGIQEVAGKFFVDAITEPQIIWKVHPCVMAEVEVNGQLVTFGIGIKPKFPLSIKFERECKIDQVGMDVVTHINIESALSEKASVTINMPAGKILGMSDHTYITNVPANSKTSIPTTSRTIDIGFEKLELGCSATFDDGREMKLVVPAFISTRDMTHAFCGEDLQSKSIYNGPWSLTFDRTENAVGIAHLINSGYTNDEAFLPPKLGKPYDDEFNLLKPNFKTYTESNVAKMEVEFVSGKFPGLVVTQVYSLYASGIITRNCIVENRGDKTRNVIMQDGYGTPLDYRSVFCYKGQITQNHETANAALALGGLDNISSEDLCENWVYEDSSTAPAGLCWPKEYKPTIQWGANLLFDIDMGELAPGNIFETKPVTYALGLFTNYHDLRNYAQQIYNKKTAPVVHTMEIVLNEYNPFVSKATAKLDIINNREEVHEGSITVSSDCLAKSETQTNPHEDIVECNSFALDFDTADNMSLINVDMKMVGYERTTQKAVFFPKGEVITTQVGSLYTVSNGVITFKADPNYGHGCFSLADEKGQEWFLNQYPEHKPYSWFNPFLGGMRIRMWEMSDLAMLKEEITAEFVKINDNMGNAWQGVCVKMAVNEDEKFKGAVFRSYFLTQPGLPVLCSFYQFENGTGENKSEITWLSTTLKPDEDTKNVIVEVTDQEGVKHCRRMGSIDTPEIFYDDMMKVSSTRSEKMYTISCNNDTAKASDFWGNIKIPVMATFAFSNADAANGETYVSNPAFIVITEKDLPQGALRDLEKVRF